MASFFWQLLVYALDCTPVLSKVRQEYTSGVGRCQGPYRLQTRSQEIMLSTELEKATISVHFQAAWPAHFDCSSDRLQTKRVFQKHPGLAAKWPTSSARAARDLVLELMIKLLGTQLRATFKAAWLKVTYIFAHKFLLHKHCPFIAESSFLITMT